METFLEVPLRFSELLKKKLPKELLHKLLVKNLKKVSEELPKKFLKKKPRGTSEYILAGARQALLALLNELLEELVENFPKELLKTEETSEGIPSEAPERNLGESLKKIPEELIKLTEEFLENI